MAGNGEDWKDDNTQTEEPSVASESMGMETQLDGLASKTKLSSMLRSARRWAQSSCHQSEHSNCFWQLDNSSSSSSRSCWSFHCLFSVVVNPICLVLSRLRLSLCAAVMLVFAVLLFFGCIVSPIQVCTRWFYWQRVIRSFVWGGLKHRLNLLMINPPDPLRRVTITGQTYSDTPPTR